MPDPFYPMYKGEGAEDVQHTDRVRIHICSHPAAALVDVVGRTLQCSLAVFGVNSVGASGVRAPNVLGGYDKTGGGIYRAGDYCKI